MEKVTIHAAKTNLSKLIARVEAGEEIILARGDVPVARIIPLAGSEAQAHSEAKADTPTVKRRLGGYKGRFSFDEAVFKPLSDAEMIEYGFE